MTHERDSEFQPTYEISEDVLFEVMHILASAHIWTLLNSQFENELPVDFKPEKWEGYELETAHEQNEALRKLILEVEPQIKERD